MEPPRTVESLDDVKAWIYEHDGRIGAWWDEQRRRNLEVDRVLSDQAAAHFAHCAEVRSRFSAIETKVARLAGIAAAIGGTLGAVAGRLFVS